MYSLYIFHHSFSPCGELPPTPTPTPTSDCEPHETLLHFAARHGLNSLAQLLLSLPGSPIAAVLPNAEGKCPIQLAKENSNEGLVQLLTL